MPESGRSAVGTADPAPPRLTRAAAPLLSVLLAAAAGCTSPDPVGEYIEGSPGVEKPHGGKAPVTGSKVTLKGSRGEVLPFLIESVVSKCERLDLGPFCREGDADCPPGGAPGLSLSVSEVGAVEIRDPSYKGAPVGPALDPVLPLENRDVCPGGDPGGKGAPVPRWHLGEVTVERDVLPGTYATAVRLGRTLSLPVTVTVWPMSIPETPALPAYAELSPWSLSLAHYGGWHEGEEVLARAYAGAMYAHRIAPYKSWVKMPGPAPGRPGVNFTSDPSPALSFRSVTIEGRPEWAMFDVATTAYSSPDKGAEAAYYRGVEASLPSLGRPGKAFVYLMDEPKKEDFPKLRALAELVRRAAPSLRILVTTPYDESLARLVDYYVPVMNHVGHEGFPGPEKYAEVKKRGGHFWWYVSCMSHGCEDGKDTGFPDMVIDRPAASVRSIGWLSMKYGAEAFLYYNVAEAYGGAPGKDPWKDFYLFTGNGDGTLFYPGKPGVRGFTGHVPVPSLRLKAWREASFDAEYVRWMEARPDKPEWWTTGYAKLAKSLTGWSRDYGAYRELRDRAGEFLAG